MKKSNIAKTKQDWELGILKGKTVFPYGYPGNKQMTMNTPAGVVPYPLEYIGLTDGKVTDRGIAQPGDDFVVNGDTVIENKLNMNNTYNPVKQFKQQRKRLGEPSEMSYEDGGDIDSVINRLKMMKKEMKKKYQVGGGIKNEYLGSALDQAQQDVDMEEATKMDTAMRNYAINERDIPRNIIDNSNTTYASKSFDNQKPIGATPGGYNIMQDDVAITENRDNMVERPAIVYKGLPDDKRSSSNHLHLQSALGKEKTGSGSGMSKSLPNFYNDVMPNFLNLEGRESDQNIGIFGPSGIKRMRELGYSDDELRSIRLQDLDSDHPVAKAIATEAQRAYGIRNRRNAEGGEDDITRQGGASNIDYAMNDVVSNINKSANFNMKDVRRKTKNQLTEEESDHVVSVLNRAIKEALSSGQKPEDYLAQSGALNDPLVKKYYENIVKADTRKIGAYDTEMFDIKNISAERGGKDYTMDEKTGKRLTFTQAFAKSRANGEPEFIWEGQPYSAEKGISPSNAPKGFYDNSGRVQSGYQDSNGYTQPKVFDRQNQSVDRTEYNTFKSGSRQKQMGGYTNQSDYANQYAQKGKKILSNKQLGNFNFMDRQMSLDNMQTPNPTDPIYNQRGAFGETNTTQDIPFQKYSDNPDLLQWDPNTGLPIEPSEEMLSRYAPFERTPITNEYAKVMQRLRSPEYTDHPGRSKREVRKLNKGVFKPQMQNGGRMASYFGEIPVGDELGGNTAPSTYFNNNRNYRSQQGIDDYTGRAMFMGQTGGYVNDVYPNAEPNAQRNIGYGRNTNYDWNLKEVGGYGDATDPYSYQMGGKLPRAQVGENMYNQVDNTYSDQNRKAQIYMDAMDERLKHQVPSKQRSNEMAARSQTMHPADTIPVEYGNYTYYPGEEGFGKVPYTMTHPPVRGVIPAQQYQSTYSPYKKQQAGGPLNRPPLYDNTMGNQNQLPKYKPGQTIQYKCGGKIKKGVVAGYDPMTRKIKLK